jgi:uridine kinase
VGTKPFLIGIGGPSCSGKTVLALAVMQKLGIENVVHFALDSYYRDLSDLTREARQAVNFDAPDALDWPLIRTHVTALAQGESIAAPIYNFATHLREAERNTIAPNTYIVVEGLLALHDEALRTLYGTAAFVEVPHAVCLERRLARDTAERGRTRESVLAQYEATVKPMAEAHILPTAAYADLVLDGQGPLGELATAVLAHVEEGFAE